MTRRLPFSVAVASAHLAAADPVVARLIEAHGPYLPRPRREPWASLVRSILFQQLAGAAALAIQRRFYSLHGHEDQPPSPAQILATTDDEFRACGVSRQKAAYLRDLATHAADGLLPFDRLGRMSDDAVIGTLTAVHGIGEWTAHMFLMFELGRPDVLPVGDLGVRAGMRAAYRLAALPTPSQARTIGEPWAPFRSVGAWYMWRAAETITP